jgi:hypothetical protein
VHNASDDHWVNGRAAPPESTVPPTMGVSERLTIKKGWRTTWGLGMASVELWATVRGLHGAGGALPVGLAGRGVWDRWGLVAVEKCVSWWVGSWTRGGDWTRVASRRASRWRRAAVSVTIASRRALINTICYNKIENASRGGVCGVPSALTGRLVLTVVKGANTASRCVGLWCHRERRRQHAATCSGKKLLAALVHNNGSREAACCPPAPRPHAPGRLKAPFLYPPPNVGHELQPRLEHL